jgi:hypothetical protein
MVFTSRAPLCCLAWLALKDRCCATGTPPHMTAVFWFGGLWCCLLPARRTCDRRTPGGHHRALPVKHVMSLDNVACLLCFDAALPAHRCTEHDAQLLYGIDGQRARTFSPVVPLHLVAAFG